MKKYISLFFLLIALNKTEAQQGCPVGYEEKNVKCNGTTSTQCVPENYACKQCWALHFEPCPGKTSGGENDYSSYEKALEGAQKEPTSWIDGQCYFYDNKKYKIYLDDPNFCSLNANTAAISALKNKILPFLQRYKAEIENYKRYFNGEPYKPGAVYDEYKSLLDQAPEDANKLTNMVNNLTADNLNQIELEFDNIQNEETRLTQQQTNYVNYIANSNASNNSRQNNVSNSNSQSKPNTIKPNVNSQSIAQQQQTWGNNFVNNYNQQKQQSQTAINDEVQGAIADVQKARDARDEQAKQEREQQEQQEQQERQQEADEKNRNQQTDNSISSYYKNMPLKKPLQVTESNVAAIYYTAWYRAYNSQIIYIFSPVTMNKYSDDTWPMYNDFEKRMTTALISKGINNVSPTVYGYFTSLSDVNNAFENMKQNAANAGLQIVILNAQAKTNTQQSNNFWNN